MEIREEKEGEGVEVDEGEGVEVDEGEEEEEGGGIEVEVGEYAVAEVEREGRRVVVVVVKKAGRVVEVDGKVVEEWVLVVFEGKEEGRVRLLRKEERRALLVKLSSISKLLVS